MNLVIDIGNTSTKMGVFSKNKLKKHFAVDGLISKSDFENITADFIISKVIISSVRNNSSRIEKFISENFRTINLSLQEKIRLPYKNLYKTPHTLGRDRMANAAGAVLLYPQKNVLIIDAGTCLKFDLVDAKGNYCGGAIAPGLLMRFKALHEFTGKLPLIKPKKESKFIGRTTVQSIRSGVQYGMLNEVVETANQYLKEKQDLNIILTGGDWRLFAEHLKKPIFADPFLTLKGLNYILDYNT